MKKLGIILMWIAIIAFFAYGAFIVIAVGYDVMSSWLTACDLLI